MGVQTVKNSKAKNTKEKLVKAFFSIYKNKKIEEINVKEITDKAGYNRGTFYIYYKSVYDLLKQIEEEVFAEFQSNMKDLTMLFYAPAHANEIIERLSSLFDKYDKYLQTLLSSSGDPLFQYQIKNMLKKAYVEDLGINEKTSDQSYKYILEYIAQANVSTISFWLVNRKQSSNFKDIMMLLHKINISGVNSVLSEYLEKSK